MLNLLLHSGHTQGWLQCEIMAPLSVTTFLFCYFQQSSSLVFQQPLDSGSVAPVSLQPAAGRAGRCSLCSGSAWSPEPGSAVILQLLSCSSSFTASVFRHSILSHSLHHDPRPSRHFNPSVSAGSHIIYNLALSSFYNLYFCLSTT